MSQESSQRKLVTIVNAERLGRDKEWVKGLWKEYFSSGEWIETKSWSEAKNISSCFIGMAQGNPLYMQSIGGDGSHSALANAYLERESSQGLLNDTNTNHDVVFGFIPAGSGNDIPRALGFNALKKLRHKKDEVIEEYLVPFVAAQDLEGNSVTRMDVGKITLYDSVDNNKELTHFFVNCFGLGYFADVNEQVSEKDVENKNYLSSLFDLQKEHKKNGAFSLNNFYFNSTHENRVHNYQAHSFEVVNSENFGGRVRINPKGCISDGSMEAFVVKSVKRRHIMRNLLEVQLNSALHLIDPNIVYKKGITQIGTGLSSPQTLQADGEVLEPNNKVYKQVNVRVLPQALPVVTNYRNDK